MKYKYIHTSFSCFTQFHSLFPTIRLSVLRANPVVVAQGCFELRRGNPNQSNSGDSNPFPASKHQAQNFEKPRNKMMKWKQIRN